MATAVMNSALIKRQVLKTLLSKIEDKSRSQEIKLFISELEVDYQSLDEIADAIYELEQDGEKITLLDISPVKKEIAEDDIFSFPDFYYRIQYDPELIKPESVISQENPFLFYLSRTEGLYRIQNGNKQIYNLNSNDKSFMVLEKLQKHFIKTPILSESDDENEKQKLRSLIAKLKDQIEKKFEGMTGSDFIESDNRRGYRLGKNIILKHKA